MPRLLKRYSDGERMNHWFVALMFVLAAVSGLAFFHPSLFFLSNLVGGGSWARILHPFMGLLMALGFLVTFAKLWRDNRMTEADKEWTKHARELLRGDRSRMPPIGKYNAGQKRAFWLIALSLLVLVVTGFTFWQPWFTPYFSISLMRVAVVLHAIVAVVLILVVTVHVYAAIWVKGSMRAMLRGTVTESWAKHGHALWYGEMTRGK
jgi:formate dehydrogenase subunit gamma